MRIKKEVEDITCDCCKRHVDSAIRCHIKTKEAIFLTREDKDICNACYKEVLRILTTFELILSHN